MDTSGRRWQRFRPATSLIVQHPDERGPSRIGDRAGEAMVGQHPGNIEIFEHETVVGINHRVGSLMQEMLDIRNMLVMPGEPNGCPVAIA